jgi:hypothetical protein
LRLLAATTKAPPIQLILQNLHKECDELTRILATIRPRNFLSVKVIRMDLEVDFKRLFVVGFGY